MEVSIKYGNVLLVNGEFMRDVNPGYLRRVLILARKAIIEALDLQYEKMTKQAPNVQRGSVWVMHLAEELGAVITPELLAVNESKQSNRDVFSNTNIELIQPAYRPFWHAVHGANFLPEARPATPHIREMEGVCLLVRDTPLLD